MDPISALAISGNIIQFLDFGFKLVKKASNLHEAGLGVEYTHLQTVTSDLHGFTEKLRSGLAADDLEFKELCDGCLEVAAEMLQAVQAILIPGKASRWKSFRQALKSILGKERIDELQRRLEIYSSQIDRRLLVLISGRVNVTIIKQDETFRHLDHSIQTAIERIEQLKQRGEESENAVRHLGEEIIGTIQNLTTTNRECHDATKHAITELSNTFQRDSTEMVILAMDCLERFKSACRENRQYQQQALTTLEQSRSEGNKQIDELKQEIKLLKQALGQSLQEMRVTNNEMSSEEQKRVIDTNNALYNLCVAKELVLRNITHLTNHMGDWMLVLETVSRRVNFLSWNQPQVHPSTELDNWGTNSEVETEFSGLPKPTDILPVARKESLASAGFQTGDRDKRTGITVHDDLDSWKDLSRSISESDCGINSSLPSGSWSMVPIVFECASGSGPLRAASLAYVRSKNRMMIFGARDSRRFVLATKERSCFRCKSRGIRCVQPSSQETEWGCLACINAVGESQRYRLCNILSSWEHNDTSDSLPSPLSS